MWNAKAVGTYRHHSTHRNTTWNDRTKIKCYRALEIYIFGQVDTHNKTLKLLYTSCCGGQTITNFNNAVSKKYFLASVTYKQFNEMQHDHLRLKQRHHSPKCDRFINKTVNQTCSKSELGFVMKPVDTDVTRMSSLSAIFSHDDSDALSSSSHISISLSTFSI